PARPAAPPAVANSACRPPPRAHGRPRARASPPGRLAASLAHKTGRIAPRDRGGTAGGTGAPPLLPPPFPPFLLRDVVQRAIRLRVQQRPTLRRAHARGGQVVDVPLAQPPDEQPHAPAVLAHHRLGYLGRRRIDLGAAVVRPVDVGEGLHRV